MENQKQGADLSTANILKLIIEGKPFDWKEQYILGNQVRKLGNAPAESDTFLAIKKPWEDELIGDADKVDLARPGIEQFYFKRFLMLTIHGKQYKWYEQYITGAEIKDLAAIEATDQLWLSIEKPWEDELISDHEKVDLARPGIEHFYSKPVEKTITLIISGVPKSWDKPKISFKEVIVLAYGEYIDSPAMIYTVAYEDGPKQNPEGSMIKDKEVFTKDKMIFHATATNQS
ncbi:multiubiquitin domain-containing protein [Mucilaginibacter glaciei]|uniref:Multiubiquitin domain-containing protein n=1 Tax=Mucilaginibacter glaciei TaxID=2772109 RepID=A0A926NTS3_9SPHI|nr:multiubiquitin domain-containing protein [Mucilaginibacter glaciei]MBD1395133.1 multiubiquitin domain-containing protein [Mucilaginibacter glaciei]